MNIINNCSFCNQEYLMKKESHRFCSDRCRKKWHRQNKGESLTPDFTKFGKQTINKPYPVEQELPKKQSSNTGNSNDNIEFNFDGLFDRDSIIPSNQEALTEQPVFSENEIYLNQLYDYKQQLEYQSNLEPSLLNANLIGLGIGGYMGLAIVDYEKMTWFQKILLTSGSYWCSKKLASWSNKNDIRNTEELKQQAIHELPSVNQKIAEYEIIVIQERKVKETVTTRRVIFEEEIKEKEVVDKTITTVKVGNGYKMMNALDLINMESEKYELDGRWADLFGYIPKKRFSAIIHGLPKNGKTHCCLQLAQYLQARFLNVIYLSGEEGTEETFRKKIERYNCRFKIIYDIKGKDGIKNAIQDFTPTFVFVDSLTRLKLDVNDVIDLKDSYPNIGFFYILHATKSGDYKGGSSIEHEVSSVVEVKKGVAYQIGRMIDGDTIISIFENE